MKISAGAMPTSENLINTLTKNQQKIAKFINLQESDADISTMRLGQEISTNLLPKAVFARSVVDLCDNGFREIFENIIVYLGPKFVGEKIFRKIYSKKLNKGLREKVTTTAADLIKSNDKDKKTLMPIKAAIAVSALVIPLAEYSLSYVKNLFTLKIFKQADFNNIANLNKDKKENFEHQEKVKKSAKNHIKLAGGIFAGCLGLATLLATRGKNSKALQSLSEAVLAPGTKFFKNNVKKEALINRYFGLDFASKNGKLAMSNGQVTACVVVGGFGYFGAAKDRGNQDFKEIAYRFPLVGFYAITGSHLLEQGLKKMLRKKDEYKDIIDKDLNAPKLKDLPKLAEKLAQKNKTTIEAEYRRLFKQKSTLILAPFAFGIGVMGFFVAGVSRYFTQYRYNQEQKAKIQASKEA